MFLLKLPIRWKPGQNVISLHSTMFLLKPSNNSFFVFDVSTLHSTMFLLKRKMKVSEVQPVDPLHSTMFLLKPGAMEIGPGAQVNFTFHNVSIKTSYSPYFSIPSSVFTFHNVSIKTNT